MPCVLIFYHILEDVAIGCLPESRAVSFENGVGKQEQPSFFEITVDRQASELFLHNH